MPVARHRGGRARGRRAATLLAVAAAALGAHAPLAAADQGGARVTVVDGATSTTVDLGEPEIAAAQDVSTTYSKPNPNGTLGTQSFSGTSAATFAALAGVTADNVASVSATVDDQTVALTGDQVRDGFPDDPAQPAGPRYALFIGGLNTPDEIKVVRPYEPAGDGHGATYQELSPGEHVLPVTIQTVHGVVGVSVSPSTARIDPGGSVRLQAATTSGSSPIDSVTWRFGDGRTDDRADTSHVFQDQGVYRAAATITTKDGRSGVGFATITVGDPPSTPGGGTPQDGASGPGGTPGAGTAGTGAASGPSAAPGSQAGGAPGTTTGASSASTTKTGSGSATGGRPRPTRTTSTAAKPATTTAPRASATTSTGAPPVTSTAAPGAAARPSRGRDSRPRRDGRVPGRDDAISGVLVTANAAEVVPATAGRAAAAAAARRGADPRGTSDLTGILVPLAIALLVGVGAARELRPRRRTLEATRMPTT